MYQPPTPVTPHRYDEPIEQSAKVTPMKILLVTFALCGLALLITQQYLKLRDQSGQRGQFAVDQTYSVPSKTDSFGIDIGTPADEVAAKRGKANHITQLGNDEQGLIVSWAYSDATYVMARRDLNGVSAYRVIEIR